MTVAIVEDAPIKQGWVLNSKDRCDSCGTEALVMVEGLNGPLMFCNHHYNKIMNNNLGYKKMMSFALKVTDEREKLSENSIRG